jgi:hypothetical protein
LDARTEIGDAEIIDGARRRDGAEKNYHGKPIGHFPTFHDKTPFLVYASRAMLGGPADHS